MRLMLDTNTCVDLIRERDERILRRIKRRSPEELCVSAVTLSELEYGAKKSANPEKNRLALAEFMTPLTVVPYDDSVAPVYGRVRTALEKAGIRQLYYPAQEAIETAMAKRLDLANTRDGLDDAERKLILAAEGLGPQLNLVGGANIESTPDTRVAKLRFHEGVYSLGVEGDLPFDRKAERNAYREALISVQRQQRNYDQEIDRIKLDVREAYRNLTETTESYRIQQMGLELAQKRGEVEELSLQYGRGRVRLLLDSEDALVQAQNDVLAALVDHTIAKLSFFRDVGILQVRPDGMWEQVTP